MLQNDEEPEEDFLEPLPGYETARLENLRGNLSNKFKKLMRLLVWTHIEKHTPNQKWESFCSRGIESIVSYFLCLP